MYFYNFFTLTSCDGITRGLENAQVEVCSDLLNFLQPISDLLNFFFCR